MEIPQAKQLLPAIGLKLGGGKIVKEEIGVGFDFIKDGGGYVCLLYTSDAADERFSVDLGGRRNIKTKKK